MNGLLQRTLYNSEYINRMIYNYSKIDAINCTIRLNIIYFTLYKNNTFYDKSINEILKYSDNIIL